MSFAMDVLKTRGVFVCKVYRGDQEFNLRAKLDLLFRTVRCEKPDSSRPVSFFSGLFDVWIGRVCSADGLDSQESREVYYIAKWLRMDVKKEEVFPEGGY